MATFEVAYDGHQRLKYYEGIVRHLTKNGPNPVTPESARRVIAVMEAAERASKTGKQQSLPYE